MYTVSVHTSEVRECMCVSKCEYVCQFGLSYLTLIILLYFFTLYLYHPPFLPFHTLS